MRKKDAPAARKATDSEPPEDIERLELLSWRFSSTEIERLSRLQLRYRERPEAIDLPLEESRLRFVRWLVEQGRIGAGDGIGFQEQLAGDESGVQQLPEERAAGHPEGAQPPKHVDHEAWHLRLLGRLARAWRCIVEAAGPGGEAVSPLYMPGEYDPWYPGRRDSYGHSRPLATQLFWLGYMPIYR
jgi:hypothetical protein